MSDARRGQDRRGERGQAMVLFALLGTVLIELPGYRHRRGQPLHHAPFTAEHG